MLESDEEMEKERESLGTPNHEMKVLHTQKSIESINRNSVKSKRRSSISKGIQLAPVDCVLNLIMEKIELVNHEDEKVLRSHLEFLTG